MNNASTSSVFDTLATGNLVQSEGASLFVTQYQDPLARHRVSELWTLYADDNPQASLSELALYQEASRHLAQWAGRTYLGDLEDHDVQIVAWRHEELGATLPARKRLLDALFDMLHLGRCLATSDALVKRLEQGAGLAFALHDDLIHAPRQSDARPSVLTEVEIHALMKELATPETEALDHGLGESAFWYTAIVLTGGGDSEALANARIDELSLTGEFALTVRVGPCIEPLHVHPVLVDIGFLGYVERMLDDGEDRLFPALAQGRAGCMTLRRLLGCSRFVAARGNGRNYTFADLWETHQAHTDTLAGWYQGDVNADPVTSALAPFYTVLGFI